MVISSDLGGGSPAKYASTRAIRPNAATCQSFVRAPISANRRATCHWPYPTALSNGEPPPIEPPAASTSAPALTRTSNTSTSSLLATQCSGVSGYCPSSLLTLGSAPASISALTTAAPLGKCPGQSVATCNNVRDLPSSPIVADAKAGCSRSNLLSDGRSAARIAASTDMASGSSACSLSIDAS